MSEEKEFSIWEEIDAVRAIILRSLGAVVAFMIVFFIFKDFVFDKIIFAPTKPGFIFYTWLCKLSQLSGLSESLCFEPIEFRKIALGFAEAFIMHIKASFFLAILIVFPYFVTQLAFYASKRFKAVAKLPRLILAGCILFYSGVAFGYIVITPLATNFLIGYNLPGVVNNPTLQSYLSYIIMFTVPTGVLFQLPLVIYFLAEGGLVTASFLRSHRRHAIVLILAVSAIVTPTVDVVSQLLVAGPLWVLFEISIFIAKRVEKRQLAEENED